MNFKIVSYYTKNDKNKFYEKAAEELKKQCETFSFDYYIEEKPSEKDYNLNIKYKPIFIKKCLEKFNQPVLFLDIDAQLTGTVPKEMIRLDEYDIGITKSWGDPLELEEEYKKHMTIPKTPQELSIRDGFLYANNNKNSINFLNDWNDMCQSSYYKKWRSHRPLDHTFKLHLIEKKPTKIMIMSGYINCCPTIERHAPMEYRLPKEKLLKENRVFCFYRVSGRG